MTRVPLQLTCVCFLFMFMFGLEQARAAADLTLSIIGPEEIVVRAEEMNCRPKKWSGDRRHRHADQCVPTR